MFQIKGVKPVHFHVEDLCCFDNHECCLNETHLELKFSNLKSVNGIILVVKKIMTTEAEHIDMASILTWCVVEMKPTIWELMSYLVYEN